MKVAVYIRVSTKDKQDITKQRDMVMDYINRNENMQFYDIFADKGISGTKQDRPALKEMIAQINNYDAVAVYKLDRIGRSMKNLFELMKVFEKNNVQFISITQAIDTSRPEGRLFFNMLTAFAQFEAEMTRQRVMDGLATARARGKKLGRPKGAKDRKKREKIGYYMRHKKERDKKELGIDKYIKSKPIHKEYAKVLDNAK
jgi:DNA invertase Pin-like site-specific DNA recombinase